MKRADLEEAIQLACEVVKQDNVYIIGSQAILGSYTEDQLPRVATMSDEVDIAPLRDDDSEMLADLLDSRFGEWSSFHDEHDFYIQGVGRRTAILPKGWQDRIVPLTPPGSPGTTGLCLDPHDLCASKLIANREKDHAYIHALLDADIIEGRLLRNRVDELDVDRVDGAAHRVARVWAKNSAERQAERRRANESDRAEEGAGTQGLTLRGAATPVPGPITTHDLPGGDSKPELPD